MITAEERAIYEKVQAIFLIEDIEHFLYEIENENEDKFDNFIEWCNDNKYIVYEAYSCYFDAGDYHWGIIRNMIRKWLYPAYQDSLKGK